MQKVSCTTDNGGRGCSRNWNPTQILNHGLMALKFLTISLTLIYFNFWKNKLFIGRTIICWTIVGSVVKSSVARIKTDIWMDDQTGVRWPDTESPRVDGGRQLYYKSFIYKVSFVLHLMFISVILLIDKVNYFHCLARLKRKKTFFQVWEKQDKKITNGTVILRPGVIFLINYYLIFSKETRTWWYCCL